MGVTIHFEGRLRDQDAMTDLLQFARRFAADHAWGTEEINEPSAKLSRVDEDEQSYDYVGPAIGLKLVPGGDCEPIRLEFDSGLYVQDWTKTQFAGPETHIEVIEFLRQIQQYFSSFRVNDEAEFWDSNDVELLKKYLEDCTNFIEEYRREHPTADVKVKSPDGRIVDMITYD